MTLHASSPTQIKWLTLTGIANHEHWVTQTLTILTTDSLAHFATKCPYKGPDNERLEVNFDPLLVPTEQTPDEQARAKTRAELQTNANKAYGIIARTLSPNLLQQFTKSDLPTCVHCLLQFFKQKFDLELEQTNPPDSPSQPY